MDDQAALLLDLFGAETRISLLKEGWMAELAKKADPLLRRWPQHEK